MTDVDVFCPPDIIDPAPAPPRWRRLIGIGGPVFNFGLLAGLALVAAFVVTSPTAEEIVEDSAVGEAVGEVVDDVTGEEAGPVASGPAVEERQDPGEDEPAPAVPADEAAQEEPAPPAPPTPAPAPAPAPRPAAYAPVAARAAPPEPAPAPAPKAAPKPDPVPTQTSSTSMVADVAPARPVPSVEEMRRPRERLFGLHTLEAPGWMAEVDELTASVGKAPNMLLFFTPFSRDYPAAGVAAAWERGALPMVSWEPIIEGSTEGQPRLADIYEGRLDAYVDAWAAAAAAQDLPIALRFGHEMNGDWYPWSEQANGNAEGDFVKAWRHLHDRFEAAGADNVIWVWSVNRIDSILDTRITPLYPGEEYVDWVGAAGYYRTEEKAPSFDDTFARTLGALRTVAPGKPVVLTEVGAGTSESNRVAWIDDFFANLVERPEILGFTWFNDVKSGGDWRLQYSAATTEAFARGVADPRYGAGEPRTLTPAPAGLTS